MSPVLASHIRLGEESWNQSIASFRMRKRLLLTWKRLTRPCFLDASFKGLVDFVRNCTHLVIPLVVLIPFVLLC